jgi:CHAD domain-containing protein
MIDFSSFELKSEVEKKFKINKHKDSTSFKISFYDTAKFEELKKKCVLIKQDDKFFKFLDKRKEVLDDVGHLYPYLSIRGRKSDCTISYENGENFKGVLYQNLTIENPLTKKRKNFKPVIKIEEETFLSFFDFIKEKVAQTFLELEIPFILNEQSLDLDFSEGLNSFEGARRAILKELIKIRGYRHFLEVDPEYLHQLRVSLRKMRTYLKVFGSVFGLKRSQSLSLSAFSFCVDLGSVRDLDVFINHLTAFLDEIKVEDRKLILDYFNEKRAYDLEVTCRTIASRKFENFITRVENFAKKKNNLNEFARMNFAEKIKESLAILKKMIKDRVQKFKKTNSPLTLHRIRILFKRYRYIYEIVEESKNKREKKKKESLLKIQDSLGFCQDMRVAENLLKEFLSECEDKNLIFLCGELMQLITLKREKEVKCFLRLYKKF